MPQIGSTDGIVTWNTHGTRGKVWDVYGTRSLVEQEVGYRSSGLISNVGRAITSRKER